MAYGDRVAMFIAHPDRSSTIESLFEVNVLLPSSEIHFDLRFRHRTSGQS
jgi:hypothetical protein